MTDKILKGSEDRAALWIPVHKVNSATMLKLTPHPVFDEEIVSIRSFSTFDNGYAFLHCFELKEESDLVGIEWADLLIFEKLFGERKGPVSWGTEEPSLQVYEMESPAQGLYLDDLYYFTIARKEAVFYMYRTPQMFDMPYSDEILSLHDFQKGDVKKDIYLGFSRLWLLYLYLIVKGIDYDERNVIIVNEKCLIDIEPDQYEVVMDVDPTDNAYLLNEQNVIGFHT